MKRILSALLLLCIAFLNAFSQQDSTKVNSPNEEIIVNKKFDEQGNMIGYDSTYTYSWSSDSSFVDFNMKHFDQFFNNSHPFIKGDSIHQSPFGGMDFDNIDEMMEHFSRMFNEPFDGQEFFSHKNDSTFQFKNDSLARQHFSFHYSMPPDSVIQKFFKNNSGKDFFENDSIFLKRDKMLKDHMKHLEEMQKEFFNF